MEEFPYRSFPDFMMVQTTSRCNAACIFCPYPVVSKEIGHTQMSFTLFRKLMNECSMHPNIQALMLFLMNEPLMDPMIYDRLNYAKEKNPQASINLTSNGCDLTDDRARRLVDSALDHIGVSMHASTPQTYRRLTGRGDFEQVLSRVTGFVELRNRLRPGLTIEIHLVGAQQFLSAEEIQAAETYWNDRGVDNVVVYLSHTNRAGNLPGTYHIVNRQICGCRETIPYHMACVLSNGDMILCCMDWRREVVLGNVKQSSVRALWHSDRRREILSYIQGEAESPSDFICKRCTDAVAPRVAEEGA